MTTLVAPLLVAFFSFAPAATDADHYQRSYDQEAANDPRGALLVMEKLSAKEKKTYVAQLRIAWLQHLSGDHRSSSASYRKAIKLAPQAIEPKLGLTLPLMSLRLWQDALGVADKILRRDPKNYLARSRRAWCLYNLGRYPQAEAAYRDVLTDYPADQEMRAGLAWSLLLQQKTEPARAEVKRILTVAPRHPTALAAEAQLGR